jgi:hypothetical protein
MDARPSFIATGATLLGIVVVVLLILAPPDWWLGQLDPLWRAAYVLRHAESFDLPCGSRPAVVPQSVDAWRIVHASPRADSIFKELVYSDDVRFPALLYGLAGVYATDPGFFRGNIKRIGATSESVHVTVDCVSQLQPLASSIADLRSGLWTSQLETRPDVITSP